MPLYFFDSHEDGIEVRDEEGVELDGPEEARRLALSSMGEMLAAGGPSGDAVELTCEVRDETGHILYSATLTLKGRWHRLARARAARH